MNNNLNNKNIDSAKLEKPTESKNQSSKAIDSPEWKAFLEFIKKDTSLKKQDLDNI